MTGPDHYREAERLAHEALDDDGTPPWDPTARCLALLDAAQVHATLALAAATAYPAIYRYTGDETGSEARGWAQVTA